MADRPLARTESVVSEWADQDLVVYDELTHTAHSLSPAAAAVWHACDGNRSVADLARQLALAPELVERVIAELSGRGLLDDGPAVEGVEGGFISRRDAAKRIATVGGAAFAAPMIYSVAIGPAMAAASPCTTNLNGTAMPPTATCGGVNAQHFGTSTGPGHCCTGLCYVDPGGTLAGRTFCPTNATCVPQGSPASSNSACCSGARSQGVCR